MNWLLQMAGAGIFKMFGDGIVQPILTAFVKAKDVDLEKFKMSETSTLQMAQAVLVANTRYAEIQSGYNLAILNWWPFRAILFITLAICATRFCVIVIDSTWWWIFGCKMDDLLIYGDGCSWSIPPIKGEYGKAEFQFLLFFVIAKPVDSAITGAVALISRYLARSK